MSSHQAGFPKGKPEGFSPPLLPAIRPLAAASVALGVIAVTGLVGAGIVGPGAFAVGAGHLAHRGVAPRTAWWWVATAGLVLGYAASAAAIVSAVVLWIAPL